MIFFQALQILGCSNGSLDPVASELVKPKVFFPKIHIRKQSLDRIPNFKLTISSIKDDCKNSGLFDYCIRVGCLVENLGSVAGASNIDFFWYEKGTPITKTKYVSLAGNDSSTVYAEFDEAKLVNAIDRSKGGCKLRTKKVEGSCTIYNEKSAASGEVKINMKIQTGSFSQNHEFTTTINSGETKVLKKVFSVENLSADFKLSILCSSKE